MATPTFLQTPLDRADIPQLLQDSLSGVDVRVIAYHHPAADEKVSGLLQTLCHAEFLSTAWEGDLELLGKIFRCAEGAYGALQFSDKASNFNGLDGEAAMVLTQYYKQARLIGQPLPQHNNSASSWRMMKQVLEAKFSDPGLREALTATGNALLLECRSTHGSDDCDSGDAMERSLRGLLLMLVREDILQQESRSTEWKGAFEHLISAAGPTDSGLRLWESMVKAARLALEKDIRSAQHHAVFHDALEAVEAPAGLCVAAQPEQLPKAWMADPQDASKQVPVAAFYFPGHEAPCDVVFQHGIFGNFYPVQGLTVKRHHFQNAEAAFQALKHWKRVNQFTNLDGAGAFQLKKRLEADGEQPDRSYCGLGGNWQGMLKVLEAKFCARNAQMRSALLYSGAAFLVEHNSVVGRDRIWSNNNIGDGQNWLGMQLMLLRDQLLQEEGRPSTGWSHFITEICGINRDIGKAQNGDGEARWQQAVQDATASVRRVLGEEDLSSTSHSSAQPSAAALPVFGEASAGCNSVAAALCSRCQVRTTFNGLPGHCSKTCRDLDVQANSGQAAAAVERCKRCLQRPTFDGRPGYCSIGCRDAPQTQAVSTTAAAAAQPSSGGPVCKRCKQKPTWDGRKGYCSIQCRDSEAAPSYAAAAAKACTQPASHEGGGHVSAPIVSCSRCKKKPAQSAHNGFCSKACQNSDSKANSSNKGKQPKGKQGKRR